MMICIKLSIDTELLKRVRSLWSLFQENQRKIQCLHLAISIACKQKLVSLPLPLRDRQLTLIFSIWWEDHRSLPPSNSLNHSQTIRWLKWWAAQIFRANQCQIWWHSRCRQPWLNKSSSRCSWLVSNSQTWWPNRCKQQWRSESSKCRLSNNSNSSLRNLPLRKQIRTMLLVALMKC